MININWVSQAKHSISQALQIRFAKAEVICSLFQPLAEPGCTLSWLPICVRSYQERTDVPAGCLLYNKKNRTGKITAVFKALYVRTSTNNTQNWRSQGLFFLLLIVVGLEMLQVATSAVVSAYPLCKASPNQPRNIKLCSLGTQKNMTAKLDIHLHPINSFLNKLLQW